MDFSPLWGLCWSAGDALSLEKRILHHGACNERLASLSMCLSQHRHLSEDGWFSLAFTVNGTVWAESVFRFYSSPSHLVVGAAANSWKQTLNPCGLLQKSSKAKNLEIKSHRSRPSVNDSISLKWRPHSPVYFFLQTFSFFLLFKSTSQLHQRRWPASFPPTTLHQHMTHPSEIQQGVVPLLRRPFRMRRKVSQPFKTQSLESPGCLRGIDWPAEKSERRVIGLKGEGTWTKMKQQESGSWVWGSLAKVFSASQLIVHNVATNNNRATMALLQPLRAPTRCQGISVTATMARCR